MEEIYLLLFANGNSNGGNLIVLGFSGEDCIKRLKSKDSVIIAKHLSDEHAAEDLATELITEDTPCEKCQKNKHCPQKKHLFALPKESVQEVLALVKELQKDGIEEYIMEGD